MKTRTLIGITNYHDEYDDFYQIVSRTNIRFVENYHGQRIMYAVMTEPVHVFLSSPPSGPTYSSYELNPMVVYED